MRPALLCTSLGVSMGGASCLCVLGRVPDVLAEPCVSCVSSPNAGNERTTIQGHVEQAVAAKTSDGRTPSRRIEHEALPTLDSLSPLLPATPRSRMYLCPQRSAKFVCPASWIQAVSSSCTTCLTCWKSRCSIDFCRFFTERNVWDHLPSMVFALPTHRLFGKPQ